MYILVLEREKKRRGGKNSAVRSTKAMYFCVCVCVCVCVVLLMAVRKRLETQQALNLRREADKTVLPSYTSQLQSSLCEENTNRLSHAALKKKKRKKITKKKITFNL